MINSILPNNFNKYGTTQQTIPTNDQQNVSNQFKSIYKTNNDVQKWVNAIPLRINDNTEVVLEDEVDENITQASMTRVQDCIVINIPTEIYNNELSTNNKNQNYPENCNIIDNNVISEVNMCTNDFNNINNNIIINEANSILYKSCHTMEVEILEEENNYDNTQIGVSAYRKLSKGNKRKMNATLRINGKSYKTRKGTVVNEKYVQPNPCHTKKCQNNCGIITEELRQNVFQAYYELDSQQKKDFLIASIKTEPVKRRYSSSTIIKRTCSNSYFLPIDGVMTKVCQQFLLKTLNITQTYLKYTDSNKSKLLTAKKDKRGNKNPPNKTLDSNLQIVNEFIKSLPAVPSHYFRASTSKKYLPAVHKNISAVYRAYKIHCATLKSDIVSETVFRNIFTSQFNIGFHTPKKDKCNVCESMKNISPGNLSEIQKVKFEKHKKNAEFFKTVHLAEQVKSKTDSSFVCTSFDLQKILNTPHGDSMLLFYSRKYTMYNETFYESGTRNGYCFVWDEQDGLRGSNEICTTLIKYLTIVEERSTVSSVSLFCDSCPGQNKNNQVLSAIFWFMNKVAININSVSITYLQPGHTYMPVDSVHSAIDSNLKKKIVWAPSEWPTIIVNSRNKPKPYEVFVLKYTDFMDFKKFQAYNFPKLTTTNDGQKIKICDVKKVTFPKKSSTILLNFCYNPESEKKTVTITQTRERRQPKEKQLQKNSEPQPAFKKYYQYQWQNTLIC